jgi:hypothetical protein
MTTGTRSRRFGLSVLVLLLYLGISFFCFGRFVDFRTNYIGEGSDPFAYIWFLNWWPWAISHGLNPMISHYVWYPEGFNMTWAGSMPVGALAISPVTAWLGPVVSYNALMLLSPALSGWTAFMLARYLTRDPVAAFFAGYLYGFSSYEIGHMLGHLNLVLVFVIPLFALIVVKRFRGDLSLFQFVAALAFTLLMQLGLSTEYLATACLFGAIAWGIFFLCAEPGDRKRFWNLGLEIALAALVTLILALPFGLYLSSGLSGVPGQFHTSGEYSADLLNFLVPTPLNLIGGGISRAVAQRFTGNFSEQGAYLGFPILLILILQLREIPKVPYLMPLLFTFVAFLILSLGPVLQFAGFASHLLLPWKAALYLPLIHQALPTRFTMYTALIAALIVADWLSHATSGRNRIGRYALALLACICLIPNRPMFPWTHVPRLSFFTEQNVSKILPSVPNVLIIPFGPTGASALWQVESGMSFTQSGGYLGMVPESEWRWVILGSLFRKIAMPDFAQDLAAFCASHRVSAVLLCPGASQNLVDAIHALHWPAFDDHEVEVVRVPKCFHE